ncbi:putative zinc finger/helix-turn-helix protein, YgiT family [Candidatus Ornithobacterium hominis]|uniref:helix-turn-helix domain-containing protein n=1 Tax=Candidatus Ornithobacterium hominis TaxID=2497989 RepID=UPI000E5B00BF|nr:helix-turn-helix domain-containing protein [Candidatus Ornithobacterium hominis]SZD73268.1 putative zinc finger/helix-turn-helix protein, YgiT family [Candidatus Ornithobacterium hominis]
MTSEELRKKRSEANLTQKELADLLHSSRKTINSYENGYTIPDAKVKLINNVFNELEEIKLEKKSKNQYPELEVTKSNIDTENEFNVTSLISLQRETIEIAKELTEIIKTSQKQINKLIEIINDK